MLNKILLRCPSQPLDNLHSLNLSMSDIFMESIFISSPDLYQGYLNIDALNDKDKKKLINSLWKYWIRSCTRCTPFANFAGFFMAKLENQKKGNRIVISPSQLHTRHVRLDMNFVSLLTQKLLSDYDIAEETFFYTNNSLYEVGGYYRYVKFRIENNIRVYNLDSAEKTDYLTGIIVRSKNGVLRRELVRYLVDSFDVSEIEAKEYLDELTHSQILLSELEPNITGPDPLNYLVNKLQRVNHSEVKILKDVIGLKDSINQEHKSIESFAALKAEIQAIEIGSTKDIIQVDLMLDTVEASIQKEIIDNIVLQIDQLQFLAKKKNSIDLDEFKIKFRNRYGDALVPIAIALDGDVGIGYGKINDDSIGENQLIEDLLFIPSESNETVSINYIDEFIVQKFYEYLRCSHETIEITEQDVEKYSNRGGEFKFSNSQYFIGNLLKNEQKLDSANFSFCITGFGAPSAANLLGRFTYASKELEDYTKEILLKEEEEYPTAIYAEIAHLPQARTGNVLLRPNLRSYEIPYVGISGMDIDRQICIDDLYVKIHNEEAILWSKRHAKRIIPRLTTAHNFDVNSLPIYKFLCDLQSQGLAYSCIWNWGVLDQLKHLPRVCYKNIIVKRARWIITAEDLGMKDKPSEFSLQKLSAFILDYKLPQYVTYVDGDNELLIDLKHDISIEILVDYLFKFKKIVLQEFLFTKENCIVKDAAGNSYTSEVIIPKLHDMNFTQDFISPTDDSKDIVRKFPLNSEWLYFKIYCGNTSAEMLLSSVIFHFIQKGVANSLFDSFFFIRYKDESPHLRVRFYNENAVKQHYVFDAFSEALGPHLSSGVINKITLDCYDREVERYTVAYMDFAERFFYFDSKCVLNFLNLLHGTDSVKYRMLFALIGIDLMLDDFGYALKGKQDVMSKIKASFYNEFGGTIELQRQLNSKYRKYQKDIFLHMNRDLDEENEILEPVQLFRIRSDETKELIKKCFVKITEEERFKYFDLVLPSFIHMYINRLYVSKQRTHELVIYFFLEKYYSSQLAIKKI